MKRKIGVGKVEAWEKPSKKRKSKTSQDNTFPYENENAVIVIPAKNHMPDIGNGKKLRVAAYCRISTDKEEQASSYENQVKYYREYIERNPDWELAGIYADKGLSGTAMRNRVEFLHMLEDCRHGKIDQIITKSVARFSRNTRECLNIIDELLSLKPPIAVIFETDNLDSAKDRFESDLYFTSFLAQNESVKKSRAIKWTWKMRFAEGRPLMPTHCILGYDKDEKKNIVIVPKEAKVVRFIYSSYLDGKCPSEIAAELTKAKIPTVKDREVWNSSVILNMLHSEKYVGDAIMQKTYTPDCLSHKSVRNTGQEMMYYKKNHHIAIISRGDWEEVQRQLKLRRYQRPKKSKPKKRFTVKRIKSGMFQNFLIIKPRWNEADTKEFLQKINEERGKQDDTV